MEIIKVLKSGKKQPGKGENFNGWVFMRNLLLEFLNGENKTTTLPEKTENKKGKSSRCVQGPIGKQIAPSTAIISIAKRGD